MIFNVIFFLVLGICNMADGFFLAYITKRGIENMACIENVHLLYCVIWSLNLLKSIELRNEKLIATSYA